MSMRIPYTYTIKFYFLLLACLMTISFLVQLERPWKGRGILAPDTMSFLHCGILSDMNREGISLYSGLVFLFCSFSWSILGLLCIVEVDENAFYY